MVSSSTLIKHETTTAATAIPSPSSLSTITKTTTGTSITTLNSVSAVTLPTAMTTTANFVEHQSQQSLNKCQQIINKNNVVHPQQTIQQQLSGNAKMGSRRIFTPQFKLQVLESYRNDNDCKGNQRATARKYNIHRRQIQKWLQCEPNLRSSVANINQSQVKHQFHNITHHHQQQSHQQHLQQTQIVTKQQMNSTLTVPSLVVNTQPPTVSANHNNNNNINNNNNNSINNNNNNNNNDVITAANFAAAVAVAASMANNAANNNERTTLSPLRGSTVTIDDSQHYHHLPPHHHLHHHHHHQHQHAYATPYTYQHPQIYAHHHNLLAVAHHLPPPPPPPPTQLSLHHSHHHHHPHQPQLYAPTTQQHEFSGAFRPTTACLWQQKVDVLEENLNKNNNNNSKETTLEVDVVDTDIEIENIKNQENNITSTATILNTKSQTTLDTTATTIITPIDLSVTKRNNCNNIDENKTKCTNNAALVVDLTFRKRKSTTTTTSTEITTDMPAEKIPKFNGNHNNNNNNDVSSTSAAAKPVKLFKPYLLDNDEEENTNDTNGQHQQHQQQATKQLPLAPIPLTPQTQTDIGLVGGTFQNEKYTFPYFPTNGTLFSPSTASAPSLSPNSFRCPKGSPVSGYESSSSTYSESSFRGNESTTNIILGNNGLSSSSMVAAVGRTSFSLELRAVFSPPHAHQHVQRWLDQDTQSCLTPATTPTPTTTPTPPSHNHNPPAAHTSIALYA